jgi:hypothetical protein
LATSDSDLLLARIILAYIAKSVRVDVVAAIGSNRKIINW